MKDWGLVNRLVEGRRRARSAVELGDLVASFPQETVRTDREAFDDGIDTTLERGLAVEGRHGARALETAVEGVERFAGGEGCGGEGVERPDEEQPGPALWF